MEADAALVRNALDERSEGRPSNAVERLSREWRVKANPRPGAASTNRQSGGEAVSIVRWEDTHGILSIILGA
jgi:hypothetical protein